MGGFNLKDIVVDPVGFAAAMLVWGEKFPPGSVGEAILKERLTNAIKAYVGAVEDMSEIDFWIMQNDELQASSNDSATAMNYASQYAEDGPVSVLRVVSRKVVDMDKIV